MASVIGAYSTGETTDQLISWFDSYVSVNGKGTEADSNDAKGTSLQEDTLYHFLTVFFSYTVFGAITLGGYIFSFVHATITEPAECDTWDTMSSANKDKTMQLVGSITNLE